MIFVSSNLIRVWGHCLWRMFSKKDHRMCSKSIILTHRGQLKGRLVEHFCLCGYKEPMNVS